MSAVSVLRARQAQWRVLTAASLLAFSATLIAEASASLAGWALTKARSDISYEKATGTLWNGKLSGVAWRGVDIGEVTFRLKPLALLTGRASAELTVKGRAGAGRGAFSAGLFGDVSAQGVNADIDLSRISDIKVLGTPLAGRAVISNASLSGSPRGCRHAEGAISTDVVSTLAEKFRREGFPLQGPIRCENGALVLPLTGGGAGLRAEASLRIDRTGKIGTRAAVETQDPEIALALQTFGFRRDNGVWRVETVVRSRGAPG